jgi:hypothetical protein
MQKTATSAAENKIKYTKSGQENIGYQKVRHSQGTGVNEKEISAIHSAFVHFRTPQPRWS